MQPQKTICKQVQCSLNSKWHIHCRNLMIIKLHWLLQWFPLTEISSSTLATNYSYIQSSLNYRRVNSLTSHCCWEICLSVSSVHCDLEQSFPSFVNHRVHSAPCCSKARPAWKRRGVSSAHSGHLEHKVFPSHVLLFLQQKYNTGSYVKKQLLWGQSSWSWPWIKVRNTW